MNVSKGSDITKRNPPCSDQVNITKYMFLLKLVLVSPSRIIYKQWIYDINKVCPNEIQQLMLNAHRRYTTLPSRTQKEVLNVELW